MSKNILIICFIVLALLMSCEEKPEEIDIPILTNTTQNTDVETVIENTSSEHQHEHEHTPPVDSLTDYTYDNTYDGVLSQIVDLLYRIQDDIDTLNQNGESTEIHTMIRSLVESAIGERDRTIYLSAYVPDNDPLKLNFYGIANSAIQLFEQYPQEASKETALIDFIKWYCKNEQDRYIRSDYIYENNQLYNLLFPNTEKAVLTESEDGYITVSYPDYDGDILIYYSANDTFRFRMENPNMSIEKQPAKLRGAYSGALTVAPVNEYGAVGKNEHLYIENPNSSKNTEAWFFGNKFYIGPSNTDEVNKILTGYKTTDNAEHVYTALRGESSLNMLSISYCNLHNLNTLGDIIPTSQIITLSLGFNALEGTLDLSRYTALRYLELHQNAELENIILPDSVLEQINISGTIVSSLSFLDKTDSLGQLDIRNTSITDLEPLSGKKIHTLLLSPENIDCSPISEIKGLKRLYVSGKAVDFEEKIMSAVSSIEELEIIYYDDKTVRIKENTIYS